MHRRTFLMTTGETAAVPAGRSKHSVCKWRYKDISLEDLCAAARDIWLQSIELLMPDELPAPNKRSASPATAMA